MNAASASLRFDRAIRRSWERCRFAHGLQQSHSRGTSFVALGELEQRRRAMAVVYEAARIELGSLTPVLQSPDLIGMTFTDRDAVILSSVTSSSFAQSAHRLGLRPGAVWTEAEQGTNGMGTCLVEGAAVLVEQQQHFLRQNAVLSCCAIPILDGTGGIAGSLNASGLGKLSGAWTIALLELVARDIEHRALIESYRHTHLLLQLHVQRELVSTNAAGILVIDRAGTVVASNRAAVAQCGADRYTAICGQLIADLLGIDCSLLTRGCRCSAESPRLLRNGLYGALVQSPMASETPPECDQPVDELNPLHEAERDALKNVLERHGDNVSRTAAYLGISRRTLHRKILRYGLQRERPSSSPEAAPHAVSLAEVLIRDRAG